MRVVDLDQAVRSVAEHCAGLEAGHVPRVVTSGNFASPVTVLGPVLAELPEARLHALNAQSDLPIHDGVVPETTFVGPGFRRHPRLAYVPCRLSMVPRLFHGPLAPDVVVVHTTTPRDGQVSLGLEVNVLPAAIEAARERGALVVAQLNPRMPWTFGDAVLPLDAVDLGVEVDVPLTTHLAGPPSDDARLIGARVAAEIGDGATLQAGIGEVPDATIVGVLERRGLKVWTEMFSDGVLVLEQAGALDRGTPLRTSFVFGSQRALRLGRRQPPRADAAHGDDQLPRRDRPAAGDDVDQHRPAGRPVRPGQRVADRRAASTAASAARPTSPSAPATHPAGGRSSPCAAGTPEQTSPRSCRSSTSR